VFALRALTDLNGVSGAWLDLVFTTLIVGTVMGLALILMRTPELTNALGTPMLNRFGRGRSAGPRKP
jgi:hypothetical protein